MRQTLHILLLSILLSLQAYPQKKVISADINLKEQESLRNLEVKLNELITAGKFDEYESYLADDYLLIDPMGSGRTKGDVLEALKSGATKGDSLFPQNLNVRIYGESAI